MLASLIIVGLFIVSLQLGQKLAGSSLIVSPLTAAVASLTALFSISIYLIAPQEKIAKLSLFAYLLFTLTIGLAIYQTGSLDSPFLALWLLVTIFAGLFGWTGLISVFVFGHGYLLYRLVLGGGSVSSQALIMFVLAADVPLLISYLVWHRRSQQESDKQRAFEAMAKELNQVANKSDIVISAIADGVLALDPRGTIQLINPAAQTLLGWDQKDAIGLDYHSVMKLSDQTSKALTPETDPIQRVIRTGEQIVDNTLTLTTHAGKQLLLSLHISPIAKTPGSGVIVVFRDITAEKAEEREQAEFVSTASHEMRTPVAAIEGYLGLALNPATATIDAKARAYLMKAHESAQHLGRLFQDLLDVSKAEDGRLKNHPSVTDVVAFMRDIVMGLAIKAQQKNLFLYYKPGSSAGGSVGRQVTPVFYVKVDNDQLNEVASNLIENAIKYTKQGSITVDVAGDEEHVRISVRDTGIGISKEDQPHLFQKFYRVDNSDTREIGGTGLGLYLSRRLAESMGGTIELESEYGKGSTFTLVLPRMSHEDAMAELEQQTSPEQSPEILLHSTPLASMPPPAETASIATTPEPAAARTGPAVAVPPRPAPPHP